MFGGMITPLVKSGNIAHKIHIFIAFTVCVMSRVLLWHTWHLGESFKFMMGHFPAPWGNELCAGPLEALMALTFGVVMLLSAFGGFEFIQHDVVPAKTEFLLHYAQCSLWFHVGIGIYKRHFHSLCIY